MNVLKIGKLFSRLITKLNPKQYIEIKELIYGRANDLVFHHNLICQVKYPLLKQEYIYRARQIIKLLNDKFMKYKTDVVIDFALISFNSALDNTFDYYVTAITNTGFKFDALEIDNLENKDNYFIFKKIKKILIESNLERIISFDIFKGYDEFNNIFKSIWGEVNTQQELFDRYTEYYKSGIESRISREIKLRKIEMKRRKDSIEQFDFKNYIYNHESHLSKTEREYVLKQINLPQDAMQYYIRYGIKTNYFDIFWIDVIARTYAFNMMRLSVLLITRDFNSAALDQFYLEKISQKQKIIYMVNDIFDFHLDPIYRNRSFIPLSAEDEKDFISQTGISNLKLLEYYKKQWEGI